MNLVDALKAKYPGSQAWHIGDNADMANELADLVVKGIKTASCGSLASYLAEESAPTVGSHNIILNGKDERGMCHQNDVNASGALLGRY